MLPMFPPRNHPITKLALAAANAPGGKIPVTIGTLCDVALYHPCLRHFVRIETDAEKALRKGKE